jgi:hypothetical protein
MEGTSDQRFEKCWPAVGTDAAVQSPGHRHVPLAAAIERYAIRGERRSAERSPTIPETLRRQRRPTATRSEPDHSRRRNSAGSFAMLTATRRASPRRSGRRFVSIRATSAIEASSAVSMRSVARIVMSTVHVKPSIMMLLALPP